MIDIILHNLLSFIFIISIIVFVHEFGHYYIAKICGVKIEQFSIGFGKEIFGFNDKHNTRWKFCLIPFGGYVKMFGDRNPASLPSDEIKTFSKEEKSTSFYFQNVYKRIAIVIAGPLANFILAIFLLTIIFKINGIQQTLPIISKISKNSPAEKSSILPNDKILKINNKNINSFEMIKEFVIINGDEELLFHIERDGKVIMINILPEMREKKDIFDNQVKLPFVGLEANKTIKKKLSILEALSVSVRRTYEMSANILTSLSQLVTGQKSLKELGGPVKIAQYSGKSINMGLIMTLYFIAIISINLGVINLLPIPTLDGGHLFFYIIEVLKGKPVSEKIQNYSFKFGITFIIMLMSFTILNDILSFFL
ncbi:MAG: regulator of sigma E protease [Rickettsiales bacterium]|jgi:regulator of sigma E protease